MADIKLVVLLNFDNSKSVLSKAVRDHVLEAVASAIEKAKQEGTITPDDSEAYLLGWDVSIHSYSA